MTPERQRQVIAEACGWTSYLPYPDEIPTEVWKSSSGDIRSDGLPPDYLNDLNAMHAAEKTLNLSQVSDYNEQIAKLSVKLSDIFEKTGPNGWVFHATASQRAEAFLRALNRWEES